MSSVLNNRALIIKIIFQSTDGNSASVAPGNCTATQTPTQVPTATETDGTTTYGHLLTFTNKYCEFFLNVLQFRFTLL